MIPSCVFAQCSDTSDCVPDFPVDAPVCCTKDADRVGFRVSPNQFPPSYVQYWVGGYSDFGEFDANAVSADMNIN